jgi:hypothetical protein
MRNLSANGNLYGKNISISQISKAEAKKLFAKGIEIYIQSSNMMPFNMWQSICKIELDKERLDADVAMNNFEIKLHEQNIKNYEGQDWAFSILDSSSKKLTECKEKVIDTNYQFNQMCNEYRYYNCDSERGNYITFYKQIN